MDTDKNDAATKLEKIKARIRALSERTEARGCTEAEAIAAMAMVGKLLHEHSLGMDEVLTRAEGCVTGEVVARPDKHRPIRRCLPGIGKFCEVKVWTWTQHTVDGEEVFHRFFGFQADVSMACYLTSMIEAAFYHEARIFMRDCAKLSGGVLRKAVEQFELGMADRLCSRLMEMAGARVMEAHVAIRAPGQKGAIGTALAVVKQQTVTEAFDELGLRLRKSRGARIQVTSSYLAGSVAGGKVNLGRPITGAAARLAIT